MKKLYTLSLFLVAFAGLSQTISFSGTGDLSANGWIITGTPTAPATSFPGPLAILTTPSDNGNSLSFAGLAASTGNRTTTTHNNTQDCNFAITSNTGTSYYSALIKATNTNGMFADLNPTTQAPNTGEYFMHLAATAGTGAGSFVARMYVKSGTTPNTFKIAILNGATPSPGVNTPGYSTTEYPVNQTLFIVVKYDRAANSASLFVNPTPGQAEPTPTVTNATGTTAAPAQVAAFCIRQSGSVTATTSTGNIEIDEVRVSDNWATVTPTNLSTNQFQINNLKVFINNKNLNIVSDNNDVKSVQLFNILGKQVINTSITTQTIDVTNLSSGIYIVKVTENGKSNTVKIVIQ